MARTFEANHVSRQSRSTKEKCAGQKGPPGASKLQDVVVAYGFDGVCGTPA
jgi:hypothetical protein